MEFTPEFKLKVYECLKNTPYVQKAMTAMEESDDVTFRFCLEFMMDDLSNALTPRILLDVGEMELWNGIVRSWLEINAVYYEFMNQYITELDSTQKVKNENSNN